LRVIAVTKYSNDVAQQGRPKSLQWRLWQPLYGPCVTLEHSLQRDGISCMLVFGERGKPENPEKNPRSREENQHKLNPLIASGPGIEHHIGARRVLSPLPHPCFPTCMCNSTHQASNLLDCLVWHPKAVFFYTSLDRFFTLIA